MGDLERRISIAIVGAPKSATTSMLRYLGQHPELYDHPQAECDFFLNDDEFARGWSHAQERYYADDPVHPFSSSRSALSCSTTKPL